MCAAISRSEAVSAGSARWADGVGEIEVAAVEGETRLAHLYQSDPCRVLFPRPAATAPFEAVFVTTSGGMVGGDRLRLSIAAGAESSACVTSQAAEKIYRSTGAITEIGLTVSIAKDATLEWMPQETIVYDGSRLRRTTELETLSGSRLISGEIVVFGRTAYGEHLTRGHLHDGWRVRRDGRLVWADALHLDGDIGTTLQNPMVFGAATASAMLLYVADDAADFLDDARAMLDEVPDGLRGGATCIGPVLILRWLGGDSAAVRRSYAAAWSRLRSSAFDWPVALPRVWET
jgi:urease accessory protein